MKIDMSRPSIRDVNICWNGRTTFRSTPPLTVALEPRRSKRQYDYDLGACEMRVHRWSFWKRAAYVTQIFGELERYGIDLNHAHNVLMRVREYHAAFNLAAYGED